MKLSRKMAFVGAAAVAVAGPAEERFGWVYPLA